MNEKEFFKKTSLATIYNYTSLYEVKMYNHKGEK